MGTKVKGLLRGLRYISQIFDDHKELEMQIGLPTDVKHVAHIGWDGPSTDNPTWMEGFKEKGVGPQSAPLSAGEPKENHNDKWVSEDSLKRREQSDIPKSTRHLSGKKKSSSATSSPKKEKTKHQRRNHLKDSVSSPFRVGSAGSDELPSRDLQQIPNRPRRKRSSKSSKSRIDSSSDSGSSFVISASDLESPIKSSNSTKKDKQSSEAC